MTEVAELVVDDSDVEEVIDDSGVEEVVEEVAEEVTAVEVYRKKVVQAAAERTLEQQRAFQAHGAARDLWSCRDEEILIEGPAGTGKTRAILEKVNFCAMKYPGCRILLVRKTRESMTQSVLEIFESKVLPPGSPALKGPKRNLRQSYYYPNGAEVVVGGIDKPGKIMSTEYDIIACFETTEFTEDDFESLTTRLRNGVLPYTQIIADCNPGAPNHWLNKRPTLKGMTRLLSRHQDNPRWFDHKTNKWTPQGESYIKKLDRLSGARKLRLRFGKWAAAEGAVYETWDAQKHHIPRNQVCRFRWMNTSKHLDPPKEWRRIRVVDFGYTNAFVCQWWAIDPDGRMFMYREIYFTKRLVREHAAIIKKYSKGEDIEATVCDWDAEDRATLDKEGIETTPAYKFITPGIEAVQARLLPAGDGRPRLFILRDSLIELDENLSEAGLPTHTAEEIDNYHYPKGQDGKPLKEEPVKKDDHGCDCMRYAVAYEDNLSGLMLKFEAEESSVVTQKVAA